VDAAPGAAAVLADRHAMECVHDLRTARSRVAVQRNGEPAVTGGIILIRGNRRDDILFLVEIGRAIEPRELVLELDSEVAKLRVREVLICVHGCILLRLDCRILDARNANRPTSRRSAGGAGKIRRPAPDAR
jgi:hypothetical protein